MRVWHLCMYPLRHTHANKRNRAPDMFLHINASKITHLSTTAKSESIGAGSLRARNGMSKKRSTIHDV